MRQSKWSLGAALLGIVALASAGTLYSQQVPQQQPAQPEQPQVQDPQLEERAPAETRGLAYRASDIMRMEVRNRDGEDLGKVEDLVIDVEQNQIRYAAISFGGFLGLGDKLFAVPMEALQVQRHEDGDYFLFDITREELDRAPGFDRDAWPDVADKRFGSEIDEFYAPRTAERQHTGRLISATQQTVTIEDAQQQRTTLRITDDTKVMVNGQKANLADLRAGQDVQLTTKHRQGRDVVIEISTDPAGTLRR